MEDDGKRWRLTLRDGLKFHDGTPVLSRDVVASIKRWGGKDVFGQTLMAGTDELSAASDREVVFRLKHSFPLLPNALGKSTSYMPAIMPERLIADPAKMVTEVVGSGSFRYLPDERMVGARSAWAKWDGYVPLPGRAHRMHPGVGWGQGAKRPDGLVENQVGLVRERFFTPRLRVKSDDELNAWLLDQWAPMPARTGIPRSTTRRSGPCSRRSGPAWCPMAGGSTASTPCPPRCPRSRRNALRLRWPGAARQQPVPGVGVCGRAAGGNPGLCRPDRVAPGWPARRRARPVLRPGPDGVRPLALRTGAGPQAIALAIRLRSSRRRSHRRGALRNGAPFKDWRLPSGLERVRRKLAGTADGDRQMVSSGRGAG